MTLQDYTAPEYPVRLSRKEQYWDVFEFYEDDGVTPDLSVAGVLFEGQLFDASGQKIHDAVVTEVAPHARKVRLTTTKMSKLRPGQYRLEVFSMIDGERTDWVHIVMTVE